MTTQLRAVLDAYPMLPADLRRQLERDLSLMVAELLAVHVCDMCSSIYEGFTAVRRQSPDPSRFCGSACSVLYKPFLRRTEGSALSVKNDPWKLSLCTHSECSKYWTESSGGRWECRAMRHDACCVHPGDSIQAQQS